VHGTASALTLYNLLNIYLQMNCQSRSSRQDTSVPLPSSEDTLVRPRVTGVNETLPHLLLSRSRMRWSILVPSSEVTPVLSLPGVEKERLSIYIQSSGHDCACALFEGHRGAFCIGWSRRLWLGMDFCCQGSNGLGSQVQGYSVSIHDVVVPCRLSLFAPTYSIHSFLALYTQCSARKVVMTFPEDAVDLISWIPLVSLPPYFNIPIIFCSILHPFTRIKSSPTQS
jgi:hypothetical protein